jgi:hypothetical protein
MMKLHQQVRVKVPCDGGKQKHRFSHIVLARDVCFARQATRFFISDNLRLAFQCAPSDRYRWSMALTTRKYPINGPGCGKFSGAEYANELGTKVVKSVQRMDSILLASSTKYLEFMHSSAFLGLILLPSWMEHSIIVTYRLVRFQCGC